MATRGCSALLPFDVTTQSDAPLVTEFSAALRRSLSAVGYKVSTIGTQPSHTRQKLTAALAQTKANRLVLLTVNEWATDTYNGTDLSYYLILEVLDSAGKVLARSAARGEDRLGMSLFNPQGVAREAAPEALKSKLGELINDARVAAALKDTVPAPEAQLLPEGPLH